MKRITMIPLLIFAVITNIIAQESADLYFSIVISEIEYITMKILVLITVIRLKISTFRLLVMLRRKTVFTADTNTYKASMKQALELRSEFSRVTDY